MNSFLDGSQLYKRGRTPAGASVHFPADSHLALQKDDQRFEMVLLEPTL